MTGRSNVGKSTLLNLLGISKIAEAGDRPGTTRSLNFYNMPLPGERHLRLVDMPGYGFAYAEPADKAAWETMMRKYLETRKHLRRIFVLLDCRHGLKLVDREFLAFLEAHAAANYQLVLTKCDLEHRDHLARRWMLLEEEIQNKWPKCRRDVRLGEAFWIENGSGQNF